MFGAADTNSAKASGDPGNPVLTATIPEKFMRAMAGRVGQSMPVGNEGAGVVVKAGSSKEAQALVGKTVAMSGGAMYSQYRTIKAAQCLVLPAGTTPADGASCFVNPLTALGMVETMRREGHTALVHTAAASNLGQMLNRICLKDGVGLVNIVRKPEQEQLLRAHGREVRVQLHLARVHGGVDAGAGGHGRHARLRRHWRGQAGESDSDLHGSRGERESDGVQPLRLDDASSRSTSTACWTAGRPSCAQLWHGLGRRRLAADAVPAEDRLRRRRRNCVNEWSPS